MRITDPRIVIVGAGMAGLTAAAYLSKAGYNVLLIEKNKDCGGLLNSFQRNGFVFDAGARSIENSGIIRPMLKELGINLDILDSPVSIGIEDQVINIISEESLLDYKRLLEKKFPDNEKEVNKIISFIQRNLKDMAILYGIDNPLFRDLKNDRDFLFKEVLPWLGKFLHTIFRMNRLKDPVEEFLGKISPNQSLNDIIDQHFFRNTPIFFALGYFYVYLDYFYPKGGTGELPKALTQKIVEWGGKIQTSTSISQVNPFEKNIVDNKGNLYHYDHLIWGADLKTLYRITKNEKLKEKISRKITAQKEEFLKNSGGDSIFAVFIGVDEPPETFRAISNGHFFYTPFRKGLGKISRSNLDSLIENFNVLSKEQILQWLDEFCQLNTYEISIPVLRDPFLAPKGKTGLIVSFLFNYNLIKKVQEAGWYEEFKTEVENRILDTLTISIYPELKEKIILRFSSTPLDILERMGCSEGGITGWSFKTHPPVISNLLKIADSIKTPIPNVLQAGQWVYSPSGIPIAILTGSLAAKYIIKNKK